MNKFYFTLFFILFCISLNAQRNLFNQRYDEISKDFNIDGNELKAYQNQGKLIIFNEEKHKTKLAKKLLKSRRGKTRTIKRAYYNLEYEVIGKEKIPHYRVRYIFIDKNKFETNEAFNAYLKKIRSLLDDVTFKSIAMQYSMDYQQNVGGDSGWFKQGKTQPEFFKKATASNKLADEIFEFEVPEINAYYFVKKTHSKQDIKEVLVVETKVKK
ncbi:MAG: hypothetical protein GVY05_00990 [Bacteroidetes bacterium]|jgi:parvulin-like peptidyl-prolyl isomerase|nr:hypothetical protein [Bacteroidota bacterium]